MTIRTAKVAGAAGVVAGAAAAALAAADLAGLPLPYEQQIGALYLLLLAAAVTLLGVARWQLDMAYWSNRNLRAVRQAFSAGVDYGRGARSRASMGEILEDAA